MFEDDFEDAGQLANYTDVSGTGWAISGGVLVAPPTSADNYIIRNGISPAGAAFIETVVARQRQGGLILRYVDSDNFYLLQISDDSGVAASNNLQLYRKLTGVYTLLGGLNLNFTRGDAHTVRFEASVGLDGNQRFRCYFDGLIRIEAIDNNHTSGGMGVRSATGQPNEYMSLRGGDLVTLVWDAMQEFVGGYRLGNQPTIIMPDTPSARPVVTSGVFPAQTIGGGGTLTNPTHGYATSG